MTYDSFSEIGSSRPRGTAPNLASFSAAPKYDLPTMVQLVGVRSMVLVGWEQQFGIPAPRRADDTQARRYSERDLIAVLWMRDQILNGASPGEAATKLLSMQGAEGFGKQPYSTRPLGQRETRPLTQADIEFVNERMQATGALGSSAAWPMPPGLRAGATGGPRMTGRPAGAGRGVAGLGSTASTGGWEPVEVGRGRLTRPVTGALGSTRREPRALVPELVRAFVSLDTAAAHRVTQEALAGRSIDIVTVNLLQPALQRIGEMWTRHEASTPEERFAENYVRAMLFSFFHGTYEQPNAPLVIVCCGPRERDEIDALTLAVAWRRYGQRVVYLGQDVDPSSLVEEARRRRPALVAAAITASQRVRTLSRLAKAMHQIGPVGPYFGFYGPVFVRNPELRKRVEGIYLGDDTSTATFHLERLIGKERSGQHR
ncbi:MAG TPA: B12-binding domain-containing protein [Ktedonobacterales bacterium]